MITPEGTQRNTERRCALCGDSEDVVPGKMGAFLCANEADCKGRFDAQLEHTIGAPVTWTVLRVDWDRLNAVRNQHRKPEGYAPGVLVLDGEESEDGWIGLIKIEGGWAHLIPVDPGSHCCFGPRARLSYPAGQVCHIEWLDYRLCGSCAAFIRPAEFTLLERVSDPRVRNTCRSCQITQGIAGEEWFDEAEAA